MCHNTPLLDIYNIISPCSLHLCVTMLHTQQGVADEFVTDVEECVREIMKNPSADCGGAVSNYIVIL